MGDDLPQRRFSEEPVPKSDSSRGKDVASFSKEQTARFLAGGELGTPKWHDPGEQQRQDLQRKYLREALDPCVTELGKALHDLSPQTEASLYAHYAGAMEGRHDSARMFVAMFGQLANLAVQPED